MAAGDRTGSAPFLVGSTSVAAVAAAAVGTIALTKFAASATSRRSRRSRYSASLMPRPRSTALAATAGPFDPRSQIGAIEPLGYWDPCDLMHDKTGAWKDEETFNWYRAAEIKHGRVAMVAAFGLYTGAFYKWPGFEGIPSGAAALQDGTGGAGFGILAIIAGYLELYGLKQEKDKRPGDLGDPLGVTTWGLGYGGEVSQNQEINHGRLAMSAVGTALLTEYWTGMQPQFQVQELQDWVQTVGWPGATLPAVLLLVSLNKDDQAALAPGAQSVLTAAPATPALTAGEEKKVLAEAK